MATRKICAAVLAAIIGVGSAAAYSSVAPNAFAAGLFDAPDEDMYGAPEEDPIEETSTEQTDSEISGDETSDDETLNDESSDNDVVGDENSDSDAVGDENSDDEISDSDTVDDENPGGETYDDNTISNAESDDVTSDDEAPSNDETSNNVSSETGANVIIPGETATFKTAIGSVDVAVDIDDTVLAGSELKIVELKDSGTIKALINNTITSEIADKSLVDAALNAVSGGEAFVLDVSFVREGNAVQPGKTVTVTASVSEKYNNAEKIFVYHVGENGLEEVSAAYDREKGTISFSNSKFSPYVFSTVKLAAASGNVDNNDNTGNPNNSATGIALAIGPIALAGGIVAVMTVKNRK